MSDTDFSSEPTVNTEPTVLGTTDDGRTITRYTLTHPAGGRLQLVDLGAGAISYRLDAADASTEVLVGFDDVEGLMAGMSIGYFGFVVGRYANRIANSRFTIDGVEHTVAANEGPTSLHGGPDGFSHRIWQVASHDDTHVEFTLTSPDGDQGFPGTVQASARYEVVEDGFTLDLGATTDAPTPVCLTSHLYLNLGEGSIHDHHLQIPASHYVEVGQDLIPTSAPVSVEGTPFDLREGARIGDRVGDPHPQMQQSGGFDHSFDVDGVGLRDVAWLTDPETGRQLTLRSDSKALQFFSGNQLDGTLTTRGRALQRGDALALEPDVHPDSPNQDWAADVVLRPGEQYSNRIEWHFTS